MPNPPERNPPTQTEEKRIQLIHFLTNFRPKARGLDHFSTIFLLGFHASLPEACDLGPWHSRLDAKARHVIEIV